MQTLLVTGGSRGIGATTAKLAAERGYAVALSYLRDRDAANAIVHEIRQAHGTALAVQADVSREDDVERLFDEVDRVFGALSVLVNNAGVVDRAMRVEAMSFERLQRMFAINVVGSIACAARAVRRMSTIRGGAGGSIVNVSSIAAKYGSPGEYADYAASKAAIDTFTLGLAKEVAAEGIRVNAVRPGIIDTEIHADSGDPQRPERLASTIPILRPGTALEVARAILFLASNDASYCTGTIVDVTGGR